MMLKRPGEEVKFKVLLVRFKQMSSVGGSFRVVKDVKRMSNCQDSVMFPSRIWRGNECVTA